MQIPILNARSNSPVDAAAFYGLNRSDKGKNGEFEDMVNMSSDRYPCLAPRKGRTAVCSNNNIRAVIAPKYSENGNITSFTGVAGTSFYYEGNAIELEDTNNMAIPASGNVTLCDFNGRIIICVYDSVSETNVMYYYDYTATGTGKVRNMEKSVTVKCSAYGSGNAEEDYYVTNYLTAKDTNFKWEKYFNIGDSVFISGFSKDTNNTVDIDSRYTNVDEMKAVSCIVEKTDGGKLYIQMYNRDGKALTLTSETADITVKIKIPTMNHVCVHNNRLWATNPNGEYIYASKLGDPFNFNTFQGLANDSFYAEIGTNGGFCGIVSFRDNLVAFKKDYIHHIYGDKPSNFTIPKQLIGCGCIDIRSAVEVNSVLYFLGYNGFYAYTGGQPTLISKPLNARYGAAVGMTDGIKYIVSAKRQGLAQTELLVYDARYNLWHKEDSFSAVGYFRYHNDLYIADKSHVYRCDTEAPAEWECQSVVLYEDIFDNKGVNEIWIRADIADGAKVTVYTKINGDTEWKEHDTLTAQGLKVYRVPVRFNRDEYFQYRLKGEGEAVIYNIEYIVNTGGRPYKVKIS